MDDDARQRLLDELRIAEKMLENLYQLAESRAALNKNSVIYCSDRAKAAVRAAMRLAGDPEKDQDKI